MFEGRTLAIDEDVLLRWRPLLEAGRKRGHVFGQLDLLIAACGLENGLIVVSRDTTHFVAASAPVLNPWEGVFTATNGAPIGVGDLDHQGLLARLLSHRGEP